MEIQINIILDEPLVLPVSYHHILQSVFYRLMSENGSSELHETGPSYGKRIYKLFTFGPIRGRYKVEGHRISFFDEVYLRFRAEDESIINRIKNNSKNDGVLLGSNCCRKTEARIFESPLPGTENLIRMVSPICVYKTDSVTSYTQYLNPFQPEFFTAAQENFKRKFAAFSGAPADSCISLQPESVSLRDKHLTTYKGIRIEAYTGIYRLSGKPEYLRFLYDTGLGSKNSQGFGMFDFIRK